MTTHLITGAGSGIGAALAQRLAARGDDLVLLARNAGRARVLRERFPDAATLVADLEEPERMSWAFGQQEVPASIDSLVHCAGIVELGPVGDLSAALWQRTLAVNTIAPAELTRLLLPSLRAARGQVVFVNSGAGLHASADWSAYAASKFALRALADALRGEEQPNGIRVTTVYPGRTATPMQQKVHAQEGRDYRPADWIGPESVATAIVAALDLPPDAELTEITVRPAPR